MHKVPEIDGKARLAAARGDIVVIIPVLNEEQSIGDVVRQIPRDLITRIIVADGGSRDATAAAARNAGAEVIDAGAGYGRACLTATMAAQGAGILVFMDGDGADDPGAIAGLIEPIQSGGCDFVIGSRARGNREPGSIAWHQLAAGRLAGWGMRLLYGVSYTDMCAFRAIRRDALLDLGMRELTYGWNIEMQMRAARAGLRIVEIPVDYHRRSGGRSKVAGSWSGTIRAGARIISTFVRVSVQSRRSPAPAKARRERLCRGRVLLLAPFLWFAALPAPAAAQKRDLVVFAEPTLERALNSIGALWQARTGTRVNVFAAPTPLSLAQIERGARCDVIFALSGAATDDAARRKVIHAGTISRVLHNRVVLVGNEPAVGSTAAATLSDVSALITGRKLAIANPERDPAGARALDLLGKLGIAVDDTNKAVAVAESSAGVLSLLATDKTRLGIVYSTDATAHGGFKLLVPLPPLDQPPIEYVVAQARDPVIDTAPFLTFLESAQAQAAFKSAGLSPIDNGERAAEASAGRQQ